MKPASARSFALALTQVRDVALVLALSSGLTASGCAGFFFYPTEQLAYEPNEVGLAFEDVRIVTSDDVELHGWFLPARADESDSSDSPRPEAANRNARGTVLFLHGNAINVAAHLPSVAWLPSAGYDVLAIDYRGYGNSEGSPDIEGVHRDARAALRYLAGRPDVSSDRIVLFGQSLGGSIAIDTAARLRHEIPVASVVADSAFADFRSITREKLAQAVITWPFQWLGALTVPAEPRPADAIRELEGIPVLLVHGSADRIVPLEQSIELHRAAGGAAELCVAEGAGHIAAFTDPRWRKRLLAWLDAAIAAQRMKAVKAVKAATDVMAFCDTGPPSDATARIRAQHPVSKAR